MKCNIDIFYSGGCILGTKSCVEKHKDISEKEAARYRIRSKLKQAIEEMQKLNQMLDELFKE
jgi:hypothetical protein